MIEKINFRYTLQVRLVLAFTTLVIITAFCSSAFFYVTMRRYMRAQMQQELVELTSIVAMQIDSGVLSTLQTPEDMQRSEYKQLQSELIAAKQAAEKIEYIYTMRRNSEGDIIFIVEGETEDPTQLGEVYADPSDLLAVNFDTLKSPLVEEDFYTDTWGTFLSGYAPVLRPDGSVEAVLGVDIRAETILNMERQLLYWSLGGMFVVSLLAVLVGMWIARRISAPLVMLRNVAEKISQRDLPDLAAAMDALAAGDLSVSPQVRAYPIHLSRSDEIGDLADAFNGMVTTLNATEDSARRMIIALRDMVGRLASASSHLSDTSAEMAAAAEQSGHAAGQIASGIRAVSHGIEEQSEDTVKTAAAVEEVGRSAAGVARSARESQKALQEAQAVSYHITDALQEIAGEARSQAARSMEAAEQVQTGAMTVAKTIAGMRQLQEEVTQAAARVREAHDRTARIGEIVETIDDIASQTNLLALNAAIEAARAGENGLGFAVVATEVRTLAEKSLQATKEIGALVTGIQSAVNDAAQVMTVSTEDVSRGEALAERSNEALALIRSAALESARAGGVIADTAEKMREMAARLRSSVDCMSALTETNAAAASKMESGTSRAAVAMKSIASVSKQNAASIEEVSSAAHQMSAQVEAVAEEAQSLARLSAELTTLAGRWH